MVEVAFYWNVILLWGAQSVCFAGEEYLITWLIGLAREHIEELNSGKA